MAPKAKGKAMAHKAKSKAKGKAKHVHDKARVAFLMARQCARHEFQQGWVERKLEKEEDKDSLAAKTWKDIRTGKSLAHKRWSLSKSSGIVEISNLSQA